MTWYLSWHYQPFPCQGYLQKANEKSQKTSGQKKKEKHLLTTAICVLGNNAREKAKDPSSAPPKRARTGKGSQIQEATANPPPSRLSRSLLERRERRPSPRSTPEGTPRFELSLLSRGLLSAGLKNRDPANSPASLSEKRNKPEGRTRSKAADAEKGGQGGGRRWQAAGVLRAFKLEQRFLPGAQIAPFCLLSSSHDFPAPGFLRGYPKCPRQR